jgi:hypothetical protein
MVGSLKRILSRRLTTRQRGAYPEMDKRELEKKSGGKRKRNGK